MELTVDAYGNSIHSGQQLVATFDAYISEEVGYINDFRVVPELRRQGYGKLALMALEKALYAAGARKAFLPHVVQGAEAFWEIMGYDWVDEDEESHRMSKKLVKPA